jgi:hypothetical protein
MSKEEKLKLKLEIYKTIYDTIALENVGLETLSNEITRIEAQLEILEEK